MYGLVNPKRASFETAPIGALNRFVPETHPLLRSVNGGANVFAHPSLANCPGLVKESDRTLGIDFAHDMNPPSTERQAPIGNQFRQGRTQHRRGETTPRLRPPFSLPLLRPIPLP